MAKSVKDKKENFESNTQYCFGLHQYQFDKINIAQDRYILKFEIHNHQIHAHLFDLDSTEGNGEYLGVADGMDKLFFVGQKDLNKFQEILSNIDRYREYRDELKRFLKEDKQNINFSFRFKDNELITYIGIKDTEVLLPVKKEPLSDCNYNFKP